MIVKLKFFIRYTPQTLQINYYKQYLDHLEVTIMNTYIKIEPQYASTNQLEFNEKCNRSKFGKIRGIMQQLKPGEYYA